MILEAIARYLTENGVGEIGQTVYVHTMPPELLSGVMLTASADGVDIDHELRNYYRDYAKLIVRAESIGEGYAIMRQILPVIEFENKTVDGLMFNFVRPMTLPVPFPRDEAGLFEISIVIEFSCYYI